MKKVRIYLPFKMTGDHPKIIIEEMATKLNKITIIMKLKEKNKMKQKLKKKKKTQKHKRNN